ncbi:hypothetical protein RJ641_003617 [Dillenia turbinata]|uniref:Uncharacterized protein n=1 Tax=Dillenia turbinata TaxID=194707 RepID=A0AAN8VE37_9MAGN
MEIMQREPLFPGKDYMQQLGLIVQLNLVEKEQKSIYILQGQENEVMSKMIGLKNYHEQILRFSPYMDLLN